MSSGITTIAHYSAGPETDIIGPSPSQVGFLAEDADEYAEFVIEGLTKYNTERFKKMQIDSRKWIKD